VDLTVEKGEFVGLIGRTGSGKSTLIQQLNALLTPDGGEVLLDGILNEILKRGEAAPAERGEFTKRAFLNGKLSLSNAEGLIELINAETPAAAMAAFRLLDGALSKEVGNAKKNLLDTIENLEAALDYPEELFELTATDEIKKLKTVKEKIDKFLTSSQNETIVRKGANVALVGAANAGKSSLFNALLNKPRAIVTDTAGTTRDTLEESIIFGAAKINLIDTAGIRESKNEIESEGIKRAEKAAMGADIILYVIDSANPEIDEKFIELHKDKIITLYNKCDLAGKQDGLSVSATQNINIDKILKAVVERLGLNKMGADETLLTNRQKYSLKLTSSSLEAAILRLHENTTELALVDLKTALNALCEITGENATEEVINGIFSKFCIGK
jgi:tRNA modification GTPase